MAPKIHMKPQIVRIIDRCCGSMLKEAPKEVATWRILKKEDDISEPAPGRRLTKNKRPSVANTTPIIKKILYKV